MTASVLPLESALVARFRAAGEAIRWRDLVSARGSSSLQLARLHEEESRVERSTEPRGVTLLTEAGPLGALVILLEADRRNALPSIRSVEAGSRSDFPEGGIRAQWPRPLSRTATESEEVPIQDLVVLARYALD